MFGSMKRGGVGLRIYTKLLSFASNAQTNFLKSTEGRGLMKKARRQEEKQRGGQYF